MSQIQKKRKVKSPFQAVRSYGFPANAGVCPSLAGYPCPDWGIFYFRGSMNHTYRQSVLNSVDGNTQAFMSDLDREGQRDLYSCHECGDLVTEDAYNHLKQCCYRCHYKEGA